MYSRFGSKLEQFISKSEFGILMACLIELRFGFLITFILATIINKEIAKINITYFIIWVIN